MDFEQHIRDAVRCQEMTNEEALIQIVRFETWADVQLEEGVITQVDAWDIYFGLMHECDERGLRDDRVRLCGKIDTSTYNPFKSQNSDIRFLATLRARMMSLVAHEQN
ncbi:MAG: hypothetical protein Q8R40_04110 [bacterium]|nr:hypothetical protein [bacterium]